MTELSTNSGLQERRFQKSYTLKKFLSRSVFGELQLMQISLNYQTSYCSEIKITGMGTKYVWLFYCFYFERNYNVFKSKSLFFFVFFKLSLKKRDDIKWKTAHITLERGMNHVQVGLGFISM